MELYFQWKNIVIFYQVITHVLCEEQGYLFYYYCYNLTVGGMSNIINHFGNSCNKQVMDHFTGT